MNFLDSMRDVLKRESCSRRAAATPSDIVVEPAAANARPVYFQGSDGRIYGPARVLDYMKASAGGPPQEWLVIECQGRWVSIVADRLRSKQAFETQPPPPHPTV